jgi:hypothetical protein
VTNLLTLSPDTASCRMAAVEFFYETEDMIYGRFTEITNLLTLSPDTASWEMAKCTLMVGLVDSGEAPDTRLTEPLHNL